VRLRRHHLRGFFAVVLLAAALAGGWMWLRDSSLVRVTNVTITGATTSEERGIEAALESAARDMTTLHVRHEALESAVAPYPSVAGIEIRTDFPHGMSIEVLEHRPVAALDVDGRRIPVSGSGVVLTGVRAEDGLPSIRRDTSPPESRVEDRRTLAALTVAAAAPETLLERSQRLWWSDRGLMLDLRNGPPLVFGTADAARAKWAAAARVLAEPSAAGATYLDLRAPGRVGAGGVGPIPQEDPAEIPQP
jgi:cell division protein FtsQ